MVFAQDNSEDYNKKLGFTEPKIDGYGLSLKGLNPVVIEFDKAESFVIVNGKLFGNIAYNSEKKGILKIGKDGKIIEAEFYVNDKGGSYDINGKQFYAPPGSHVIFLNGEIEVKAEEGSEIKENPKDSEEKTPGLRYSGKDIKLPENKGVFTGKVGIRQDGSAYIDYSGLKEGVIINNVKISSKNENIESGSAVSIYFDGKTHSGDSVVFSDKTFSAKSEKIEYDFDFLKENKYSKIDAGDYFSVELKKDSSFLIENRDEQKIIPRVETRGDLRIVQDSKSLESSNGNILIARVLDKESEKKVQDEIDLDAWNKIRRTEQVSLVSLPSPLTTSPIELTMLDKDGNDLLGKYSSGEAIKGSKIIVDNFNRIGVIPGDKIDASVLSEGIDTRFSALISYNYVKADEIKELLGKEISFDDSLSQGVKDLVSGRLRDYISAVSAETRDSIKRLFFADYFGFGGFASPYQVYFASRMFDLSAFSHEAGHSWHFQINEGEARERLLQDSELKKKYEELDGQANALLSQIKEKYNQISGISPDAGAPIETSLSNQQIESLTKEKSELEARLNDILDKRLSLIYSSFDKKWDAVNNQNYGQSLSGSFRWKSDADISDTQAKELEAEFGESWKERPMHGYVRPYGDTNRYEDVATFIEAIVSTPEVFAKYINPESKYYDARFRQKIDLLNEYKAITSVQYNRVLKLAGVKSQ